MAPIEVKTNIELTILSEVIISNYIPTQGPSLDFIVIPYQKFYLVDPKLWDGITGATSIFRVDTYIKTDTQNIISSLLRFSKFIKQCSLNNKTEINIPFISPFSSTA